MHGCHEQWLGRMRRKSVHSAAWPVRPGKPRKATDALEQQWRLWSDVLPLLGQLLVGALRLCAQPQPTLVRGRARYRRAHRLSLLRLVGGHQTPRALLLGVVVCAASVLPPPPPTHTPPPPPTHPPTLATRPLPRPTPPHTTSAPPPRLAVAPCVIDSAQATQ